MMWRILSCVLAMAAVIHAQNGTNATDAGGAVFDNPAPALTFDHYSSGRVAWLAGVATLAFLQVAVATAMTCYAVNVMPRKLPGVPGAMNST